jgi:acyl-CoA thioesterase I
MALAFVRLTMRNRTMQNAKISTIARATCIALSSLCACEGSTGPSQVGAPATPSDTGVATRHGFDGGSETVASNTPDARAPAPVVALAEKPIPAPLVSRGKRVLSNVGKAAALVDGSYFDFNTWSANPTSTGPAWAAFDIGIGPTRLLLNWCALANGGYTTTNQGALGSYRIETSTNSTNGEDGTWTTVATVTDSGVAGQRWVRLFVTDAAKDAGGKIAINEVDIHDVSAGTSDTWVFLGDSVTALSLNRRVPDKSYPGLIHRSKSAYFPAMIGAGMGGTSSNDGVKNIDNWIALNPDMKFWAIAYGTNDAAGDRNGAGASKYESNLRTIITKLRAAGRTAILPTPPFNVDNQVALEKYATVIEKLRAEFSLPVGPDLFGYFQAHPTELVDKVHPGDSGQLAINKLWATAMLPLYP